MCVSVKTVVERKQQTNNIYCSEQSNQYIKERIKQKGREEGNRIKRKERSLACFEDEIVNEKAWFALREVSQQLFLPKNVLLNTASKQTLSFCIACVMR